MVTFLFHLNLLLNLSDTCEKGLYAVRVSGRLAENIVEDLSARGIPYRSRDEIEE